MSTMLSRSFGRIRRPLGLLLFLGLTAATWVGLGMLAAKLVWDVPVEWSRLLGWLTHPIFMVGEREVSLWSLAQVVLWTLAALWAGRLARRIVADQLLRHYQADRGVRDAVGTIVRYVVVFAGILVGLSSVGIGLGALAVLFGVVGIGIGFGLQNIANNFISGFIILFERPIRKGDFIEVDGMFGQVKSISARSTTIETRDAVAVIVPNADFISGRVINWSHGSSDVIRCTVSVGVAYDSDPARVERILKEVAERDARVLAHPPPQVRLDRFGESSLDFVLHAWTQQIWALPTLISDLNLRVLHALRDAGIEIPFPQRDLHVRSGLPEKA